MENKRLILLAKYSLMFGGALGFISIIPYINILSVLIMSICSSVIIVFYFQKQRIFGELTMKGAAILGTAIGIISLAGFLIIFLPLTSLLGTIFSKAEYFMSYKFLWQIWWVLMLMGGLITARFNAASLMAYVYIKDTFFMIKGEKEITPLPDFFKKDK